MASGSDHMQTPTTAQLRTAIKVLKMLGERINNNVAKIEGRSIEQISRIEIVSGQLKEWRTQLQQQKRQCVTQYV
jgi:hypothetical protein